MDTPDAYSHFSNLVSARFSCRAYTDVPVSRDQLLAVLETARLAPSACNRQPWKFVMVTDDGPLKQQVLQAYPREWAMTAPALIVACGDHTTAWHRGADGKDHTDVDIAIAVEHICLAAASLGLGTCWVCNFDPAIVASALNLPDNLDPIAIIPIGHPAVTAPARQRKSFDEILQWGKF